MDILIYLPNDAKKPVPLFVGLNFGGNQTINSDPGIKITQSWVPDGGKKEAGHRAGEASRDRRPAAGRWMRSSRTAMAWRRSIAATSIRITTMDFRTACIPCFTKRGNPDRPPTSGAPLARGRGACRVRWTILRPTRKSTPSRWPSWVTRDWAKLPYGRGAGRAVCDCHLQRLRRRRRRNHAATIRRADPANQHVVPALVLCEFQKIQRSRGRLARRCPHARGACRPAAGVYRQPPRRTSGLTRGEFLAAYHASPVYELLGKPALKGDKMPQINQPVMTTVGYHIRTGKHDVTDYDWKQYLKFADMHFGR